MVFPGGYDQVPPFLGQETREISSGPSGVRIDTDKESFEAEAAVVTLPLGVLKSDSVRFDPALPEAKTGAIARLGTGRLEKIALDFLGFTDTDYGVVVNLYPITGAPVLVFSYLGEAGSSGAGDPDEVMGVLRPAYGTGLPEPTGVLRSGWLGDRFARGSYSSVPVGARLEDFDALARRLPLRRTCGPGAPQAVGGPEENRHQASQVQPEGYDESPEHRPPQERNLRPLGSHDLEHDPHGPQNGRGAEDDCKGVPPRVPVHHQSDVHDGKEHERKRKEDVDGSHGNGKLRGIGTHEGIPVPGRGDKEMPQAEGGGNHACRNDGNTDRASHILQTPCEAECVTRASVRPAKLPYSNSRRKALRDDIGTSLPGPKAACRAIRAVDLPVVAVAKGSRPGSQQAFLELEQKNVLRHRVGTVDQCGTTHVMLNPLPIEQVRYRIHEVDNRQTRQPPRVQRPDELGNEVRAVDDCRSVVVDVGTQKLDCTSRLCPQLCVDALQESHSRRQQLDLIRHAEVYHN